MKRVVARDQQVVGTFDDATLVALLNAGTLKLTDQHWDAATSTWRPLTDFVGHAKRRRNFAASIGRIVVMLLVAGCGSAATWWVMRDLDSANVAIRATLGIAPVTSETQIENHAAPEPPAKTAPSRDRTPLANEPASEPSPATSIPNAPTKKRASEVLTLLNVEVFDEEMAVTVENHGAEPVDGFDLKLKFFELPAEQRVFDQNAKEVAKTEISQQNLAARIKSLDQAVKMLGLHLKLAGTDVITWTPSHIKALPKAGQWAAFEDAALAEAGDSLTKTAHAFAEGASSLNATIRHEALTGHLLDLARKLEDIRPLIQSVLDKKQGERRKLAVELEVTGSKLAVLHRAQEEIEPKLAALMNAARSKIARAEITHVEASVEAGNVQRITIRRSRNDKEGLVVELARADEKSVAMMPAK